MNRAPATSLETPMRFGCGIDAGLAVLSATPSSFEKTLDLAGVGRAMPNTTYRADAAVGDAATRRTAALAPS